MRRSLALMACFAALAASLPVLATDVLQPARATSTLLEQGVLGAIAVLSIVGLVAVWLDARRERKELHEALEEKDAKMLAIALGQAQRDMEAARREENAVARALKNARGRM